MNRKRFYIIGLVACIVLFFGSMYIPKTMGDTPMLLGSIGLFCFPVFLIALIVHAIRSRRKPKQEQPAPVSVPDPAPSPVPVPVEHVSATPAPDPMPSEKKKVEKVERVHVRGVNYNTKNIEAVGTENPDYSMTKKELVEYHEDERVYQYDFYVKGTLVPEPDNQYDPNAIMVQANGLCIGHVPAGSTAHIRKLMESGRIDHMNLEIGGGRYKIVYEDDDEKYELERGSTNYSAVLELYLTE